MSTVFISYRRQTAPGEARALFNDLAMRLGKSSVFMDVDSIALGRDFRGVLQKTLASVDFMLVLIDKDWASVKDDKGKTRLESPGDYVRQEVEAALKRDIVVTPVLVKGAQMPTAEELPAEIRELSYRNAFELTYNRWESDLNEMVRRLGLTPSAAKTETAPPTAAPQGLVSASSTIEPSQPIRGGEAEKPAGGSGIYGAILSSGRALASAATTRKGLMLLLLPLIAAAGIYAWFSLFGSSSGPLAPLRLAIVSGQQDAGAAFVSYLKEQGAVASVVKINELGNLSLSQPDVVVISSDTVRQWRQNDANHLKQIFENYKVIGVGEAGDELFRLLGLPLSGVMGGDEDTVTVTALDLLKSPIEITADESRVDLYKVKSSNRLVGLYDGGSPDIAGFDPVARWQKHPHHWPIARRGNYLFFGFDLAVDKMTENGKSLLVNLISNHKAQPWLPLSKIIEQEKARKEFEKIPPGLSSGVINAQLSQSRRTFEVNQPGLIKATLTWELKACPLSLILNGPGQVGYYARKNGESPLSVEFAVTPNHIARGREWALTVSCFADMGTTSLDYTIQLAYPPPS